MFISSGHEREGFGGGDDSAAEFDHRGGHACAQALEAELGADLLLLGFAEVELHAPYARREDRDVDLADRELGVDRAEELLIADCVVPEAVCAAHACRDGERHTPNRSDV